MANGVLLDVADEAAIKRTVDEAVAQFGTIDVFVNNAGYGLEGAVEEISMAQARDQFEVNFFGAVAMIQAVLPGMRKQHSGHILSTTSTGTGESRSDPSGASS